MFVGAMIGVQTEIDASLTTMITTGAMYIICCPVDSLESLSLAMCLGTTQYFFDTNCLDTLKRSRVE